MEFFKHLILIAFALFALTSTFASAEPQFGGSRGTGLSRDRPYTLPPQRPVQPDFNKPQHF